MKYKRKKNKRKIRCTLCTKFRWLGNNKDRRRYRDKKLGLHKKIYASR